MPFIVRYKKLSENAKLPAYAEPLAAAADLYAIEDVSIEAGETKKLSLGFAVQIPKGYEAQIRMRSGLASKGIQLGNGLGVIDESFRGELGVLLYNSTSQSYQVKKHDRIAQMAFAPVVRAEFKEVAELEESSRGSGGFGSTGV